MFSDDAGWIVIRVFRSVGENCFLLYSETVCRRRKVSDRNRNIGRHPDPRVHPDQLTDVVRVTRIGGRSRRRCRRFRFREFGRRLDVDEFRHVGRRTQVVVVV